MCLYLLIKPSFLFIKPSHELSLLLLKDELVKTPPSLASSCVYATEAPVATVQRITSLQVQPCHGIPVITVQQ